METTKAKWIQDGEGAWACFLVPSPKEAVQLVSEVTPDKKYVLEVKEKRERRSLDANAYFWVLIDKLAARIGVSKQDIYRSYIRDIGGNSQIVCVIDKAVGDLRKGWEHNGLGWVTDVLPSKLEGCTNVILYYGSSTYDTKQMIRLIDFAVQDCKTQGIETMQPEKLKMLLESWERH